ncbi:MAG: hypothetical protein P4L42_05055 [Desulfocapsaceae bacterium]|nr:hypothetical protein [Desulfocapsaceae bacterium]
MPSLRRLSGIMLLVIFVLSGCTRYPVRHLASDASLIVIGKSSRNEVLTYLGEPDSERMVSADTAQWVYFEEDKSILQMAPLVGKTFSPSGYKMIVITFKGDLVTDCRYSSYDKDEFDWSKDYRWQDKKE